MPWHFLKPPELRYTRGASLSRQVQYIYAPNPFLMFSGPQAKSWSSIESIHDFGSQKCDLRIGLSLVSHWNMFCNMLFRFQQRTWSSGLATWVRTLVNVLAPCEVSHFILMKQVQWIPMATIPHYPEFISIFMSLPILATISSGVLCSFPANHLRHLTGTMGSHPSNIH